MIPLQASDLARVVGGTLAGDDVLVRGGVQTDSRLVEPGDVFVAMPGEVTDGHRFVATAVAAGAALVVCERPIDDAVPHVVVPSGLAALQALAAHVVAAIREGCTIVGITGSNGKTTTKNMLQAILERHGETVSPVKSFNNEVGAPMTMLRATSSTRFLVLELGASREGDIASLVRIAMPDVAVVLKVGLAHAGEFGGVERTQRAKHELVRDLPADAVAILNHDDDRVAWMAERTAARVRWFGLEAVDGGLWADDVDSSIDGTTATVRRGDDAWPMTLRILGEHHVMNALAALSVADELGVAIPDAIAALESMVRAERWRMELLRPESGVVVINDSYNASPDSMAAALRTLAHVSRSSAARSVAVIGAMTELGDSQVEEHDRVGRLVVRLGIDRLVVVGAGAKAVHDAAEHESSYGQETTYVETSDQALALLRATLQPGDVVLVKSSLSAGLKDLGDAVGGVA
ncbi:UDP-N-acetylmuramoyl-tripeptide--D-alanyl-D-alanine ligase [Agrococcus versicolor]|uniref:UDP-N-acetylmuramoyl-tripeptide--D-alanyl-D-alanine ligase n=1 Tax=Agrococcus versicolor TaxID=501482 RepID=A0ABN3AUJ2_9MICO